MAAPDCLELGVLERLHAQRHAVHPGRPPPPERVIRDVLRIRFEGDLGDRVGGAVPGPDQPTAPEEPETATPEDALAQADELLKEAQEALDANDLGTYQEKVDEAATLIDEALATLAPATRQPAGEPGDADAGSETETEATAPSTAPLETVPVDGG